MKKFANIAVLSLSAAAVKLGQDEEAAAVEAAVDAAAGTRDGSAQEGVVVSGCVGWGRVCGTSALVELAWRGL